VEAARPAEEVVEAPAVAEEAEEAVAEEAVVAPAAVAAVEGAAVEGAEAVAEEAEVPGEATRPGRCRVSRRVPRRAPCDRRQRSGPSGRPRRRERAA
jgi:hypothetical protein